MSPPQDLTLWGKTKFAFSSPSNFHKAIALEDTSRLVNEDLAPSPPSRRTWNAWHYASFWWSESWNVSTWSVGSSMIAIGLSVRDAILIVFFANLLSAILIAYNGRAASMYHIGFPALARSPFGTFGSYFFIVLRSILGIIWGGVQLYFTGQFICVILRCIFSSFTSIPNDIPASQGITTQEMLGFFLAFCVTIPFAFVHTSKIYPLFTVKSFIVPIACLGIVIWATTNNGGVSASTLDTQRTTSSTTAFAFSVLAQWNSVMGSNSALLITVPDVARYAKSPRGQFWGQLLSLPIAGTICASFGIIVTSAVQNMWGETYWNPYGLLTAILDHDYNSKARAGCFFAALCFGFATLGTSLACNVIPFAADMCSLLPKYLNIKRAQFLCILVAFAITPWRVLTNAPTFLAFLSGYAIFQGNIVAILLVDYFFVRRGNIDIAALYSASRSAKYYYTFGVNWRAVLAFVVGFTIPLPGFIASMDPSVSVAVGATYIFNMGWLMSFCFGAITYWLACLVMPVPGGDGKLPRESLAAADATVEFEEANTQAPSIDTSEKNDGNAPAAAVQMV